MARAKEPPTLTLKDLGLTIGEMRDAYTGANDIRGGRVRRVIPYAGRFWFVPVREGYCGPVETFILRQLIAGDGQTWQERRARTGEGSTTELDQVQLTSADRGHWLIQQAVVIRVVWVDGEGE